MIRRKSNHIASYLFFSLVILIVFSLQASCCFGQGTNSYETYTDLPPIETDTDIPKSIRITVMKIMNYVEDSNLEGVTGAGGFHFQLFDESNAPVTLTGKNGKQVPVIIPFSDDDLEILSGVKQTETEYGVFAVDFNPKLLGFESEGSVKEKKYLLKEIQDGGEHRNVNQDKKEVYVVISYNKTNNTFTTQYKKYEGFIQQAVFKNEYKPKSCSITIPVSKTITEPREWLEKDAFTFEIEAKDNAPISCSKQIELTNEEREKSFDLEFTFDDLVEIQNEKKYYVNSKDFKYDIIETRSRLTEGMSLAPTKTITVRLKNNRKTGELSVFYVGVNEKGKEVEQNNAPILVFENEYKPKPAEVIIKAKKVLRDNITWPAEGFTFQLFKVTESGMVPEKTMPVPSDTKEVSFDLSFSTTGKYNYVITELEGNSDEIYYDRGRHSVEINVTIDPDTGGLKTKVIYPQKSNEVIIKNEKMKTQVQIKAEKISNINRPGSFTFYLTPTYEDGTKIPNNDDRIETSNEADGGIIFTLNLDAETYFYKMSEKVPEGNPKGWMYDDREYFFKVAVTQSGATVQRKNENGEWENYSNENPVKFTNTYSVSPVTAEIGLEKRLEGRKWLEQDNFVFRLRNKDGSEIRKEDGTMVPYLETSAQKGNIDPTFPLISYIQEDLGDSISREYKYIIEEIAQENVGIIPDTPKEIKVTLENDEAEGKLKVKYGEHGTSFMDSSQLVFLNHYEINDKKNARIDIYKKIANRAWKSGDVFSFQINAISTTVDDMVHKDIPMPESSTIQITGNSENVPGEPNTKVGYFEDISYTIPGNYWYIIKEVIPNQVEEGMEYDLNEYYVEVRVEDNGNGKLKEPTVWYPSTESEKPPVFINTYNKKEEYRFLFSFTKQWYGVSTDNVSFILYNPDGTERKHRYVIEKESDKLWKIKYWLSSPGDYYVIENIGNEYIPLYQNRGTHEEVQDRVYNGGKIINVQAPPTGDKDQLNVLFVIFGICLTGILIYAGKKQGKKDNR